MCLKSPNRSNHNLDSSGFSFNLLNVCWRLSLLVCGGSRMFSRKSDQGFSKEINWNFGDFTP